MTLTSVGDKSQHFLSLRNNMALKTRLGTLVQELSTGQSSDLVAHLGSDQTRLLDVDRQLLLLKGYGRATTQTAQTLSLMQVSLEQLDATRGQLASEMLAITSAGGRKPTCHSCTIGAWCIRINRFNIKRTHC